MEECRQRYRYSILKDKHNYTHTASSAKTTPTSQLLSQTHTAPSYRPSFVNALSYNDRKAQQ